ncbi:CST complex subunit TEN1 [Morus notabilis]|uniref:CST complex subunit TEN1 n=1 Tax=Morus notabilis TaxID=981085 RepID=UPI000CED7048|nr:CST complex subunit TEN1 [Morus notabilis]XP_024020250.1 CST complex subunit TEN1 [Morus notabilis]XP_024020251.1 CST complex subunit TEN1 [Morus notabilis]
MASSEIKSGALVSLEDLHPNSPNFKQGASLRVTGKLEEYSAETAIAMVVDGDAKLKINTEHLREISFRIGSIYQFVGELIQPDNQAVLQARVGRNVDGINLSLYHQSLQLLRQFEANRLKNPMNLIDIFSD